MRDIKQASERKRSKKRDAILKAICETESHPSAEWVYARLKPEFPDLSLGTVYRNIAQFKEEGNVVPVVTVAGTERIDGNTTPHAHFVCQRCGAVVDIWGIEQQVDLDSLPGLDIGVEIKAHSLVYYGHCADCLNKGKS